MGATTIELDQADGRGFVDALLDREPNRLQAPFFGRLSIATPEGHALFAVELLHTLAADGWLSQGLRRMLWVDHGALDWTALPPRVEAFHAGSALTTCAGRPRPVERRLCRATSSAARSSPRWWAR